MISVQILRAIAALMVVVLHILNKSVANGDLAANPFIKGEAGVDLFFIISGFIMSYITANKNTTAVGFISNRIIRIIPLYWTITTVAMIGFMIFPTSINWGGDLEVSIFDSYFLTPSYDALLVPVAWTLRFEFLFYFIFSACLLSSTDSRKTCIAMLLLLSACSLYKSNNLYLSFITSPLLIEFAMGMISFYFYGNKTKWQSLTWIAGIAALLMFSEAKNDLERVFVYGLPMMLVFVGVVSNETLIANSDYFIVRLLKKCGDASYSIYLTHFFIIGLVSKCFNYLGIEHSIVLFIGFSFIGSIFCGLISYAFIEVPLTSKAKSLLSPIQAPQAR